MPATLSAEEQLAEANAKLVSLAKSIETLGKPASRASGDLPVDSDWSDDEEPEQRRGYEPRRKTGKNKRLQFAPGYKPTGIFRTFGDYLKKGFRAYQSGNRGQFIDDVEKSLRGGLPKAIQGMSEAVMQDGGVSVIPEFSKTILENVYANNLYDMTDQYTVGGNSMKFPRNAESSRADGSRGGGIQGFWTDEGATITSSRPKIENFDLKLKKLAVVVYLTDELLEDNALALEQYVIRKVSEELNFKLGDAIINGNGQGQPLGILNSLCLVSNAKEAGQAATTFVAANAVKMHARRLNKTGANYVWLRNQDTTPQFDLLNSPVGTAGGQLIYLPPGGLSGSSYATLYGHPVIDIEFAPTLGTVGDVILANFSDYVTISKGGIQQAESMHIEFLTDQTALRFIFRVDGAPWAKAAVTPFKGSNTQSSFVVTATR